MGEHDERVRKGFAVASNGIITAYNFRNPYAVVHNIRGNNTSNDHDTLPDDRHISY
jgi:hypothetical protein